MTCKIALVDDHKLFRDGLKGLLNGLSDYSVVIEASTGEEFLEQIQQQQPDVVFMDISMPGIGGIETTRQAIAQFPDMKIITLSMFGDENYYSMMVEAGAKGFLLKDSDIEEVINAIESVRLGSSYFTPSLLSSIANRMKTRVNETAQDYLSQREVEILVEVCKGLSNSEIADTLFISKRTVDKHRANILEKTRCKNTAALVVYAIRNKIVEI